MEFRSVAIESSAGDFCCRVVGVLVAEVDAATSLDKPKVRWVVDAPAREDADPSVLV